MKKKALNYIFFTLAFFSLFFSEKAYALTQVTGATINSAGTLGDFTGIPNCTSFGNYGFDRYFENTLLQHSIGSICSTSNSNFEGIWGVTYGDGNYIVYFYQNSTDYNAGTRNYYAVFNRFLSSWSIGSLGAISSTTRITTITSPTNGSTTSGGIVDFNYSFFNGSEGYDRYGFELRDITGSFQYTAKESSITASGNNTVSTTTSLTAGHLHLWRPYLKRNSDNNFIYGNWISFDVSYASSSSTPLILGNEYATSTTGFLPFLNISKLLQTKAPFAYIPQVYDVVVSAIQTSTSTIPSTSINFVLASGTTAVQTVAIDLFSTSTITHFLTPTYVGYLRALMVAVTYISTMLFLFKDAQRRHII